MGRVTCEDGVKFTMAKLQSWHNFRELVSSFWYTSTWSRNGDVYASIRYRLDVEGRCLYLKYNWRDQPIEQTIRLTTTPLHFGGERWWFICSYTQTRCAVLYSPPGQPYFASRKAFNGGLPYESQSENHWDRLLRRSRKLEDRYGVPDWGEGWFPKPKGMHLRTYHSRLAELDWYQRRLDFRLFELTAKTDPELLKDWGG